MTTSNGLQQGYVSSNNNHNKDEIINSVPMFVIFGRPGAGKTTIANVVVDTILMKQNPKDDKNNQLNYSCLALDLDVCVPVWMKDNFAKGQYPTLEERKVFAIDACQHVERKILERREERTTNNQPTTKKRRFL